LSVTVEIDTNMNIVDIFYGIAVGFNFEWTFICVKIGLEVTCELMDIFAGGKEYNVTIMLYGKLFNPFDPSDFIGAEIVYSFPFNTNPIRLSDDEWSVHPIIG